MKQLSITILFLVPILCMGQNCEDLPKEFTSFTDALSHILNTNFVFSDTRSETIRTLSEKKNAKLVSADYYSCDNKTGYATFTFLPGDVFIYEKIPMKIWDEYKKCISPDLYYENNILTKYKYIFKQLRSDVTVNYTDLYYENNILTQYSCIFKQPASRRSGCDRTALCFAKQLYIF